MKTASGISKLMKLFSDETRLRTLMLLNGEELCVCQLMGILGVSQPLVSRNLAMLFDAGLLDERRQGKLIFYKIRPGLPEPQNGILKILLKEANADKVFMNDLKTLKSCKEFQKSAGSCDMKTFLEFMEKRRRKAGCRL